MNLPALLRPIRRLRPQKVRTRLTLIYTTLFFTAGSALLALTYGLVASSLPAQPPLVITLNQECKQAAVTGTDNRIPAVCAQAFNAGAVSGWQAQRTHALTELLVFSLVGLAAMTLASGGLGWFMSGRVLRPVRMITETARRASEQRLGERLALTGATDELKELADTFDDMLERLDAAFATQRRFVANASHELRTPLTVMRTAIDVTLAKPSRTVRQLTDMATRVRHSIDRAETIIEALLTLAVSDQGTLNAEFTDLATCAEDAIETAAADIQRLNLRVDTTLDPAETTGDPHLLERMIVNLVNNAVRHNQPGGWIRLRTGTRDAGAYIKIANSGPLVPADTVPTLFEPFRRMQARIGIREGFGLGLPIARSVVTAHHATITVRSQPAGGLDISVEIPHCPTAHPHPPTSPQPQSEGRSGRTPRR